MRFRNLAAALLVLPSFPAAARTQPRLHVEDAGTGFPVVFVPGLAGSTYSYRKVTSGLVELGFRTLVVEPLGTGNSPRPGDADYSFSAQAERVARELEASGVERAAFVAQGSCASIVYRLALERPEMVAGVVSLEGGAAEEVATPGLRKAVEFAPLLRLFGGSGLVRKEMKKGLERASGDPSWVTEEAVDGYAAGAAADLDATLRALQGMARAREPEPLGPRLREIQCPVELLLGGAPHEGGLGSDEHRLLRQSLPNIRIYTVPGAGHFLAEEQPTAVMASVIRLTRSITGGNLAANTGGSHDPEPRR